MIRIFGGELKGRALKTPKGSSTRPSSGLVRQALFNICQGEIEGARVLDLFAGSGAIGIEALSRGAKEAVFIESDKSAARTIQENLQTLSLDHGHLYQGEVLTLLSVLEKKEGAFDLIFADPPYFTEWKGKLLSEHILQEIASRGLLKPNGRLFIEEGKEISLDGVTLVTHPVRRYGKTYLHSFTRS